MNNNFLNQLRQKGIKIYYNGIKIKITPTELITEKIQHWLCARKYQLLILLKKENQLRKLINNVGHHDNWTEDEMSEMFDYAINHIGLDAAISSYQTTARCQARIISLGLTNTVFCKTCQKHIQLGKECPSEILNCPCCIDHLANTA